MNDQPTNPTTQTQPINTSLNTIQPNPVAVPAPITAPQQVPVDPNAPLLKSNVGHAKKLLGFLPGRAYGREDTLCLYKDRIEYRCAKNPADNFTLPLQSIAKVKQRSIEFRIYLQDGSYHLFEIGDPFAPLAASGNLTAMGIAGVATTVMDNSSLQDSNDVFAWTQMLPSLGVTVDNDPLASAEGRSRFTIKIVLWTFIFILALPLIGTTLAVMKGTPDAVIPFGITAFIMTLCVVPLFFMRKKK